MDSRTSVQDVMRCDLCETAIVQMHCDTCLVNLCKACVGEHFSADLSKPHKIVDFKDRNSTPLYPECKSHDKERCKMYCKQCDISVCICCIASNEHLGHGLSKLLLILEEKKKMIMEEQTELKEKIYPTYQDIASDVQNRISQLEKEYGDLSTAITNHGEEWHKKIDKLVKKLKAEVDEMKNTQLKTLQKQMDELYTKISGIKAEIDSIDVTLDSNDISKVLNVTSNVKTYTKVPQKVVQPKLRFIPGRIQGDEFDKHFGALSSSLTTDENGCSMTTTQKSPEAGSSPRVKKLLDVEETVTTIHTGYAQLYNVACLSDEEIWTSGNTKTMKLYSINQGSLLKSITTKSGHTPYDIAVTKSADLLYTDNLDRTVNIAKNEKIEEVIRLENWVPKGVCITSSGDFLVIMNSDDDKQTKVVSYYGSTEKQTIQFDDKGEPLYSPDSNYKYITENRNLDICVSDNVAVVVVNQGGKLRFRYTGHNSTQKDPPFSTFGISTDSQSHILTADYNHRCVHIIDQDGQFLRYICELSEPWGLCTDTNDNLFVAQDGNGEVKKIRYLQ